MPELFPPHVAILRTSISFHNELRTPSGLAKYTGCIAPIWCLRLDDRETARTMLEAIDSHIGPLRGCCWEYGAAAADSLEELRERFVENHRDLLGDVAPYMPHPVVIGTGSNATAGNRYANA
ncbi:hypothetical protein H7X87_00895 [Acetobacteraceae bacterium]|nr:hypothetical protein [Candidatus Parcubacteria bacterium]